jgi:hypothetical protein
VRERERGRRAYTGREGGRDVCVREREREREGERGREEGGHTLVGREGGEHTLVRGRERGKRRYTSGGRRTYTRTYTSNNRVHSSLSY